MNEEDFKNFNSYFYPHSVALVGVSSKNNYFWLQNFVFAGFQGKVFPVNPKGPDGYYGISFFKSLLDISEPIDYAVIAVPAPRVPQVLRECIEKKVRLVTIFTSGFSETGQYECTMLENKLVSILKEQENNPPLRVIGPNCMGLYCPESHIFFRPDLSPRSGDIGFISQSGGLAINLSLKLKELGVGVSKVISHGNQIDLTCSDFLKYLTDDKKTKIIGIYIEGIRSQDRTKFFNALQKAALKKPVIIWKGGTTEEGSKAAASHTGAIAGSMSTWNAVIKQAGVIKVNTFEDLIDSIITFKYYNPYRLNFENLNKKAVLVSISGGSSVTNTDEVIREGLQVPKFDNEIQEKIKEAMIYDVGINYSNPLDLATDFFNFSGLKKIFKILIDNPFSIIIFEVSLQYVYVPEAIGILNIRDIFYKNLIDFLTPLKKAGKLVAVAITNVCNSYKRIDDMNFFMKKFPVYDTVRQAARALNGLIDYRNFLTMNSIQ